MRGVSFKSGLRLAALLSVCLHAGVGYVAGTLGVDTSASTVRMRGGSVDRSLQGFNVATPPETSIPTPDETAKPLSVATIVPEDTKPAPPVEDIEHKLILGIEESNQKSPNWLGSAHPTEHKAKLSSVEQPELDPNPGFAAPPLDAGATTTMFSVPFLPDALRQPEPTSTPPTTAAREGAMEGREQPDAATIPREGEDHATGERASQAKRGASGEKVVPDLSLPGPAPEEIGVRDGVMRIDPTLPVRDEIERPRKVELAKSVPAVPQSDAKNAPTNAAASPTNATGATTPSANGARSNPPSGASGQHPGEKSPKEADASSTTPTVEIRPGMPAAAQGLDITTKRPNFTRLTRVTAYPANPLLKVTFNRNGIVSKVVIVESSGAQDVDDPVVNAVYQWTARGKILTELAGADPNTGITVSVRILLH